MQPNFDRLVVGEEPCSVLFTTEPYVILTKSGFTVAADVLYRKGSKTTDKTLLLGAKSLSTLLVDKMGGNGDRLFGLDVWIYKNGPEKTAAYVVED